MNNLISARFSQFLPRYLISSFFELRYGQGKLLLEIDENPLSKTVGSFHNFFTLFYDYKFVALEKDSEENTEILQKCLYFDIPLDITKKIQVTKDEFYDINFKEISIGDMYLISPLHEKNSENEITGSTLLLFHSNHDGTLEIAKSIEEDD